MDRMEIIAASVNERLAVHALISLNDGCRSKIGDWIAEGDKWIMEDGKKVSVSECFFNCWVSQYTRAPQTITTKPVEIPKPISVLPEVGERVFCSHTMTQELFDSWLVHANSADFYGRMLKRGRLHLTAEAAIAHSKADIEAAGGTWE